MKKIFLSIAIVVCSTSLYAKIWRVNNDVTKDPDVTQAATLFDGTNNATNPEAANGDTVHIEPSTSNYLDIIVNKQVVILGNGYLLTNNIGLQANTNASSVNNVTFNAGSENSVMAGITTAVTLRNVGNITITRCRISSVVLFLYTVPKTGISLNKNFITGSLSQSGFDPTGDVTVTIENNIFNSATGFGAGTISLNNQVRGLFRNNTYGSSINFITLSNFYFANNIILGNGGGSVFSGSNNIIKNNINNRGTTATGGLPAGNGNQNITDVQMYGTTTTLGDVFAGDVFNFTSTTPGDARFELRVGGSNTNPAIAAGETIGTVVTPNVGAYGATDPYRKSGIPAVPTIYALSAPASVAPTATSMNVTISTRSNN
jgi:hypothetical protein